jgi:hypothetical protein
MPATAPAATGASEAETKPYPIGGGCGRSSADCSLVATLAAGELRPVGRAGASQLDSQAHASLLRLAATSADRDLGYRKLPGLKPPGQGREVYRGA